MLTKNRRFLFILLCFGLVVLVCARCMNQDKPVTNNRGEAFAGSDACKKCHQAVYDSFVHTAHHNDSKPATKEAIKGSFAKEDHIFLYGYNRNRLVVMEERNDGLYQAAYLNGQPWQARRFDVVIGSGRKGQSYLTWVGNQFFQLPISYFTPEHAWINSPGFPEAEILFNRVVYGRCLECHTTFAKALPGQAATGETMFDNAQIIYGIDCERCHGAAAKHVTFHTQHPEAKQGAFIVNLATLSRQQRLDACALCHSGLGQALKPPFSFSAGDTLAHYYTVNDNAATNASLDVHGNQYGLLKASKCFVVSGTMDCGSCHNTHQKESSAAVFSQRCMTCHTEATHNFCKMAATIGPSIKANCIDCHMPVQASKTMTIGDPKLEAVKAAQIRSHLIAVYTDATKKYLDTLQQRKAL